QSLRVLVDYGCLYHDGIFYKVDRLKLQQINELRELLYYHDKGLHIDQTQIHAFMQQVVPGLKKLSRVQISPSISDRVQSPQLKAKLYVDYLNERIAADLEFQYGDII